MPDAFAGDPDRLARFEREAQVLASLNHSGIGVIHDIQEDRGTRFLVLELVEGETLAARLKRGPLPVDEALELLKQVAEALEAAHEKGIFHRDLKPANIQITPAGRAKVLDFGLAKMSQAESAATGVSSDSPTLDAGQTVGGVILGTAAYMSPEQARGRPVDKRTDIFAFGCVMYEALSGEPAFAGETVTDVIASVVKAEPDWSRLAGDPVAVVEGVMQSVSMPNSGDETGAGQFNVSRLGTLLYAPGGAHPHGQNSVVWVDRGGVEQPEPSIPVQAHLSPRLSPDGEKIVALVRSGPSRNEDVWTYDTRRGTSTRLTFSGSNWPAFWSPDGKRVVLNSNPSGVKNLFMMNADGSGPIERLTMSEYEQRPSSLTAQGNRIACLQYTADRSQIWACITWDADFRHTGNGWDHYSPRTNAATTHRTEKTSSLHAVSVMVRRVCAGSGKPASNLRLSFLLNS